MEEHLDTNENKEERIQIIDVCKMPRGNHIIYRLNVNIDREEWDVGRRYRDFLRLHVNLMNKHPNVVMPYFPPKEFLGHHGIRGQRLCESRQILLEDYLRRIRLHPELKHDPLLSIFLDRSIRYLNEIPDVGGMKFNKVGDLWRKLIRLPSRPRELITEMEQELQKTIDALKCVCISISKANYHREMGIEKLKSIIRVFEECSDVYAQPNGLLSTIIDGMKTGIQMSQELLTRDKRLYFLLKAMYRHRSALKERYDDVISSIYQRQQCNLNVDDEEKRRKVDEEYDHIMRMETVLMVPEIMEYLEHKEQKDAIIRNIWIKGIDSTSKMGYPSHVLPLLKEYHENKRADTAQNI